MSPDALLAMVILSWNTNHRKAEALPQVSAISSLGPDVVLLQEVTPATAMVLKPLLVEAGFMSVELSKMKPDAPFRHGLGVLTASKYSMEVDHQSSLSIDEWREKVLSSRVQAPHGEVHVHNAHIPPGSTNGEHKIAVLKAIYEGLSRANSPSAILCGDFNTPRLELPEGHIITWAQHETAPSYQLGWKGRGKEWDEAERNVILDLPGMRDAFRSLHGYRREEFSWQHVRKGRTAGVARVTRRRCDHAFVSSDLEVVRCEYIHEWRERGLSDHSALLVEVTKLL